jgi:RNA polymerase-associated protein CTR9
LLTLPFSLIHFDLPVGLKVWKKDYDRVIALAKGAYSSTTVAEIQAESLFFLARVYHVREDHDNAHKFYEKACSLAPNLTPARFGLAQILIVKDDYKQAMGHLNKVLAASASATDALSLLGLLEVRAGKDIEEGLARLRKAVELDPLNPDLVVMEALALQQHESNYGKALERYQKAVDLMKRKRTKVPYEIYTNSGVLCHQTKRFDEASDMYQQALASLENFSTACVASLDNLGVDGGRIRHPDNSMFFDYVDSKLKIEPVDIDGKSVMKILDVSETDLPSLAISVGDHIKLKDDFFSVIESVTVKDGSVILTTKDSFDPMETAEENKDPMETETPEKSKESLSVFVKRENEILKIPAATTIAFNIARLHEVTGRTMAAIELHKAIAKRNPAYVNSYLRLACIAVDCGSLSECSQWLKIAAASAPGNPEVLALIGNLHLSLCDWAPAQTVFSSLLEKKISSVEAYASLSLGNIYFANLHVNEEKYARHLQHASDFYRRILTKDAANAYAANGLGTVLAERGEIFKAKEVFNRVREVSGDTIADALLNLGHIYLAQKKHPEALQMYTSYMKRAEDGTTPVTSKSREDDVVDVLMYIAFAYFDWARHTELFNDANAAPADGRYRQAMEHLELAIGKHTKKEVVLKYNLCMTKLQAGNCQLQKLTRNIQRTVEDVEEALQGLKESQATVEEILSEKNQGNKVNIPTSTLQDFLKHCKANIASAESHLDDEKTRAEEASAERKIRQLAAEAAMKEETLKQAILEEEKTKKQEERDQKADAKMRQVDELRAGWEQEQDSKQVAKDKKSKKPSGSVDPELDVEEVGEPEAGHGLFDDSDEDGSDAEQGAKEGKSKPADSASKATTNADLFGDSDEDDDDGEKADKAKGPVKAQASNKDPFADSDDDDDEDEKPGDSSAPAEAKANSKDPFGDSDDDDDDDINASKDATKEAGTGSGQTEEKKATSAELFGDSDEGESDEELVRADTKRKGAEAEETQEKQPQKKRKVLEDDEED